jgi:hypothetical protein
MAMSYMRQISAFIAFLSLVSVTVALCCGTRPVSAEPMPMDHSAGHSNHEDADSCCLSHDVQALQDGPTLALPGPAGRVPVIDLSDVLELPGHRHTDQTGWPPGRNGLTSIVCTFLI